MATLNRPVNCSTFFVDAEIAFVSIRQGYTLQMCQVITIKERWSIGKSLFILLIKNSSILTEQFVTILIILPVLGYLVDKK